MARPSRASKQIETLQPDPRNALKQVKPVRNSRVSAERLGSAQRDPGDDAFDARLDDELRAMD
jgi:hypothetical protein